ncbi:MAG: sodium:proton antiporter [Bradymonadaceae bacterium]|nr:sodium:proton antiporter [Lujinxingiaceae bacterium]
MNRAARLFLIALLAMIATGLAWAVFSMPAQEGGLGPLVASRLDESGTRSEVTATLLNFRAYDTLLEIAVLLLAMMASWSLRVHQATPITLEPGPVLLALVRHLAPVMVLVAGYLAWVGSYEPGGAFQAGAVLGAAGVLVLLSGLPLAQRARAGPFRIGVVLGLAVFATLGLWPMLFDAAFLEYPAQHAHLFILLIEIASALSIGLILLALFAGRPPTDAQTMRSEQRLP